MRWDMTATKPLYTSPLYEEMRGIRPGMNLPGLNSNMERQDLRFGAISCTLTFDATNVLLDGAFDNE